MEPSLAKARALVKKPSNETVLFVWRCGGSANRRTAALGPFTCPLAAPIAVIGAPFVWANYIAERAALDSTIYFITINHDKRPTMLFCKPPPAPL